MFKWLRLPGGEYIKSDDPRVEYTEGDLRQRGDVCRIRLYGHKPNVIAMWDEPFGPDSQNPRYWNGPFRTTAQEVGHIKRCISEDKCRPLLLEADALIHGDRAAQYGNARENFGRWSALCKAMNIQLEPKDIALVMVLGKLAREVNKHKRDNAMDAAGYLGLYDELMGGE